MPRSRTWTKESVKEYWKNREADTILSYSFSASHSLLETERNHADAWQKQNDYYMETLDRSDESGELHSTAAQIGENLAFWIKYLSWSYCDDCHILKKQVLPHNYGKRSRTAGTKCICKTEKYIIPNSDDIPLALCNLTMEDIYVLRPFDVHCGDIARAKNGYRLKNGHFRLTPSKRSVEEKIASLSEGERKGRIVKAYNTLMGCSLSSYSKFVELRERYVDNGHQFSQSDIFTEAGIECAIWHHSILSQPGANRRCRKKNHRESSKAAFMAKLFSNVIDYALSFELLLFQYDRWLFKTVTGAINSARILKCSPMRALDSKTFSPGYWQWQHLFLLDAVRQFGLPSLFLTISPFEWTFPFPIWLNGIRKATEVGKTFLPGYETMHIANVLEQLVRGYLCGSNSARWFHNVLQFDLPSDTKNVQTYFYRFEFQKRGTMHIHLLVWLHGIEHIQYDRIRADIPSHDGNLGFLAYRLQKSEDKSPFLQMQDEPTYVDQSNDKAVLRVVHPANALALNLRAYIDTLLPTLKCSMDVQTTDGKSMVLKYVSSYVSKWHDAVSIDSLYSPNVSGHQTASCYLKSLTPCEPEMWMSLSNVKIAWSCSRTKRFIVPLPEKVTLNKQWNKYRLRPAHMESLTFAEWLRAINHTPAQPKEYKSGNTLVGLKFVSVYRKEFFFQQLLMSHPHRQVLSLYHGDFERMPENLRYFASAILLLPKWNNDFAIREHFEMEGHKQYFIDTVIAYIASLHDLLQCWRLHVASNRELSEFSADIEGTNFNLQGKQLSIMQIMKRAVVSRNRSLAYDLPHTSELDMNIDEDEEDFNMDEGEEHEQLVNSELNAEIQSTDTDWKRFLLVTGNPGCGKTHTMNACIAKCIAYKLKVCVVAPTGFLACKYKAAFGEEITTDTVHAAFKYPIDNTTKPSINWELARFDFMVIDEISMIPKPVFRHILSTIQQLPIRPIVFFSGDEAQQQPIMTVEQKIVQVPNIMNDHEFLTSITHIKLTEQFRCLDPELQNFQVHVRNWKPTQAYLDSIQKSVMCYEEPSDQTIVDTLKRHPDATVLTVTNNACNRINMLVVKHGFPDQEPIASVPTDSNLPEIQIYKGMRIMLTQNRKKERGFVNGQQATVKFVTRKTVFASLNNGQLLNIHLVTFRKPDGTLKTAYPFVPAYANTISKAQGQTLSKVLLWFDIAKLPPGTAYVAVSRVRTLDKLLFLTPMKVSHFTPVIG